MVTNQSKGRGHELHGHLQRQVHWKTVGLRLFVGLCVLGASGVRFSTFLIATAGLIPGLFVEVYFGYIASTVTKVTGNVSEHSTLHTVLTAVGFAVCIVLMILITRVATKALAEAEGNSAADMPAEET